MATKRHSDDRISTAESKFYLPAGATSSSDRSRLKRIWEALFSHQVHTPE